MNLLREKLAKYDAPQRAKAAGIYPYFREIQSDQDTEVVIDGKKVLMFGSNAYLGLTNQIRHGMRRFTLSERYAGYSCGP